jgi:hypothetical protein
MLSFYDFARLVVMLLVIPAAYENSSEASSAGFRPIT